MSSQFSFRFKCHVINSKVSMVKCLEKYGLEATIQGACYCPFHQDENHKSGKLYKDNQGEHLFCFAEHRIYRPTDAMRLLFKVKDLDSIFDQLWGRLSAPERKSFVANFESAGDYVSPEWKAAKPALRASFMQGKINLSEYLVDLERILEATYEAQESA